MKIDLHCHTQASPDSRTPIEEIPYRCRERGITVQAITDHHAIWAAQQLQALVRSREDVDLTVIVGEEIKTRAGELVGLFLQERIPPNLSAEQTVKRIKDQGGLVLLPHGFDRFKVWRLKPEVRQRIVSSIDIVEAFNAHVNVQRWNLAAAAWAKLHSIPTSAGSDAHTLAEIGKAWVETPDRPIHGPQDLLDALQQGKPTGEWRSLIFAMPLRVWDYVRRWVGSIFSRVRDVFRTS